MKKIKITIAVLLVFSIVLFTVASGIVFATSENWIEVTRFSGGSSITTTRTFTCDHGEWRISWEYEPRTDNPGVSTLQLNVHTQEFQGSKVGSLQKWGTEETNGILYIHDKSGTFYLDIICSVQSYTLIIEQNSESVPEFPSWTPLLLVLIVFSVALIIYKRRLKPQTN
jgi:hypothetical protein